MKSYNQILEEIFSAYPMYHKVCSKAYKEGLENIEELLAVIDNPHKKPHFIHVAGTNGKGSVSAILASFFQELGYKTGLFTSPHLVDFRERIRVNGEMISEEDVIRFFDKYQKKFSHIEPSFFEITTALAFYHFSVQNVNIAIIEVGLGGRLDATNVVNPLISVITNISLEHTQMLGNTISEIAREKGGIIKHKTPVIVGEYHPESFPIFEDMATKLDAPLFLADQNYSICGDYKMKNIEISDENGVLCSINDNPLRGDYQLKNITTAYQTIEVAKFLLNIQENIFANAVKNVVKNTHFRGRWQILAQNPLTICDVAHNPAGIAYGMTNIDKEKINENSNINVVFGMVKDKDIDNIVKLLNPNFKYYVCCAKIERSLNPDVLTNKMKINKLDCKTYQSVEKALAAAKNNSSQNDVIFITGSCFVVGEALEFFL